MDLNALALGRAQHALREAQHDYTRATQNGHYPMHRRQRAAFIACAGLTFPGLGHAGHEFPFYPSFYPQEITVEALDATPAALALAKGTLHAYAGIELAAKSDPGKTGTVASLGGFAVATLDPRAPGLAERSARCAAARGLKDTLGEGVTWHPYAVTPFHADYLHHADRAEAARVAVPVRTGAPLHARVEIVDVAALMGRAAARYNGWSGPPWIRQGWFHAYLLLAPAVTEAATRARIDDAVRRLMRGDYRNLSQRIDLERSLVALLQGGCERVVLGYTVRRETYGADYSQGVENVGYDALEGMASGIFPRTVKLRDFPWNGWLNVAVPSPPSGAWNPVVGGFGDAFGRLVREAIADTAFLASPHGGGWIENRVNASVAEAGRALPVPEDALLPEPGSGRLVPVGRGKTATMRIIYRVRNSDFHDGTPMNVADLLYAYAFAAAWGTGKTADPGVAQATALARERLKGLRLMRVETETLAFGEDVLRYEVPVIEVYVDAATGSDAASIAPPWSTLPWHLLALLEEGARRRHFVLSAQAAARGGPPELDPVRDATVVRRLDELARELEERAYVPAALASYVGAEEARARYRRLREFHKEHGHWLVTNGPYVLGRWDGTKAVFGAFRDPSYPKGIGSFDAYAVPLRAHVTRIETRKDGADVHTESEWLQRLGRDVRIMRGSFAKRLGERLLGAAAVPMPACHYLLVAPDGSIASAGAANADGAGTCHLEFSRTGAQPEAPGYQLVVAAVLEDNRVNAPIRIVPWTH